MRENHQENIRNFVIISHIDHGKSTLADRFLELTGTVAKHKMRDQYLDQMDLERERGITIKMQPVRMHWYRETDAKHDAKQTQNLRVVSCGPHEVGVSHGLAQIEQYVLNLIDTPGHVDFSYEVSRALAAVEGAILLVDAAKGVQAQTLSNLHLAEEQGLVIIPAVNKIDLPNARIKETKEEITNLLDISSEEVLEISAKLGTGMEELLKTVVAKIPSPRAGPNQSLRALIFDSKHDLYKGVIAYIRIFDGEIKKGERIKLINQNIEGEALEVGIFKPELTPTEELQAGEIGYVATGIKEAEKVRAGETITKYEVRSKKPAPYRNEVSGSGYEVKALSGYKEPKSMVFASFYPESADDYENLKDALGKLKLQDASLYFEDDYSPALGRGYKCGFLGLLHMEIISERLKREFALNLVITSPTVLYKLRKPGEPQYHNKVEAQGQEKETPIRSPQELPQDKNFVIQEPWAKLEIITPQNFLGKVMELLEDIRGEFGETQYLGKDKILINHKAPLQEIISGLFDKLKSVTSGYASMNYTLEDFRKADLDKLEVLVAGEKVESLSQIVFVKNAYKEGKKLVEKLKEVLPPQQFAVALQAVFRGRIIARENIKALRKDVIAGLYGGDYTRKRKLLEKQKKGKKKMKALGKVRIPSEVFLKILRR